MTLGWCRDNQNNVIQHNDVLDYGLNCNIKTNVTEGNVMMSTEAVFLVVYDPSMNEL